MHTYVLVTFGDPVRKQLVHLTLVPLAKAHFDVLRRFGRGRLAFHSRLHARAHRLAVGKLELGVQPQLLELVLEAGGPNMANHIRCTHVPRRSPSREKGRKGVSFS